MSEVVEATGNEEVPVTEIVETVVETPAAPVVLRYEYQPTDEAGRPIGGLQVIKYTTPDELAAKLSDQNVQLLRKLRKETRERRLGIPTTENIGDAPRFQSPVIFQGKNLSPDEVVSLSRTLGIDPEDFDAATDALFEAKIGVKPSDLRNTLTEIQEDRIAQRAITEVNAFMAATPEYVKCEENFEALTNWMLRNNLQPVRANFKLAFDTLSDAGILIENPKPYVEEVEEIIPAPVIVVPVEGPVVVEEPVAPVVEEVVVTPPAATPRASGLALGLSKSATSAETAPPAAPAARITFSIGGRTFTDLAAINAMPADEYRRRTHTDPNFVKIEKALEAEAEAKRKAKARS